MSEKALRIAYLKGAIRALEELKKIYEGMLKEASE